MLEKVEKCPFTIAFMLFFLPTKWKYHLEKNNFSGYKSPGKQLQLTDS